MRPTTAFTVLALTAGLALTGCSQAGGQESSPSASATPSASQTKSTYELDQAFYAQTPYGSHITVDFSAPAPEDIEAYRQAASIEPGSYAKADLDNREGTDNVGIYKVVFYDEDGKAYEFGDVMDHVSEWQAESNYDSENPQYTLPDGTAIPEAQYQALSDQWSQLQDAHFNTTSASPHERSTGYIASAETELPERITAIEVWPGGIIEDPIYMVPISEKDGYEVPEATATQAPQSDEEAEVELQQWKDDGADCADDVLADLGPKAKVGAAIECAFADEELDPADQTQESLSPEDTQIGPPPAGDVAGDPADPGAAGFTYDEAYAAWQSGMAYYDAFCLNYQPTTPGGESQCEGIEAGTVDRVTGEYIGD